MQIQAPRDIPGKLKFVGEHLFGTAWKRRLAVGLGVSRSTLHSWLGGHKTDRDIEFDLVLLIDRERVVSTDRAVELTALRRAIESTCKRGISDAA